MSSPISIVVSLLSKATQKIDDLNNKCHELESRKDQWKLEYEKYSRIGNVAIQYLLCQGCLDQNTHEGQTVEICQTCTQKLQTLRNAKAEIERRDQTIKRLQAEVEYWKKQMHEESEIANHWMKAQASRTSYQKSIKSSVTLPIGA